MSAFRSQLRWPLMAAVFCLAAGMIAGAWGGGLGTRAAEHARTVEVLSEAALVLCLSCTGLKLSAPLRLDVWRVPLRLAAITLPATVGLIAGAANVFLGLPIEQAVLLGAILAPTDPVLAAGLRLPPTGREESTRFALTAEGALTSSLALPVVLFAQGLCGQGDLGSFGLRWVIVDALWPVGCGAVLGWAVGSIAARALRRLGSRGEVGLAEMLLFASAVALTYGAAFILRANGFVAVLVAGSALARGGVLAQRAAAPSRLARSLVGAAGHVERVAELAIMVVLGALLAASRVHAGPVVFALVVLVAVRPLAARLGIGSSAGAEHDRQLIGWFGMRGVASMYYLMFSVDQTLSSPLTCEVAAVTLTVLAASIALHGLTSMPLGKQPAGQQG
jgi:sodium/hydrogen antiporter